MSSVPYGISVLFSVYKNEKPLFLKQAVESMVYQTRVPDEIVIVEDGPLTDELYSELNDLQGRFPDLIQRYPLAENQGLGLALKFGVEKCRFSLIARMDTDDISVENRLALQEKAFEEDGILDIVGGHISEFMTVPNSPTAHRRVPLTHEEIAKYQKKRSAFNHVTVMFKKDAVLKAGNYEHGLYMEDDLLWLNMLSAGANTKNLDLVLCHVRVGDGMYERRGGFSYLQQYSGARKLMYKRHQIGFMDYASSVIVQSLVAIVPTGVRKFIFTKLLREKISE
ncbi:glycosyltransferase [Streptococcus ovis]|uniref:glycosyltransferase n=1 Tax=Streptococcus ovis TaxID=82806 RepID=UPI0003703191|nr:glycosyltransferase [Streptococcus ovis]